MEQEIDLKPFFLAIIQRWRLIAATTILAAALAGLLALLVPASYSATSSVLIFIRQTGTELGPNRPLIAFETIDIGARRNGMVALSRSEVVELMLPPDVLQRVAPPDYEPGMFIDEERVTVQSIGDLLKITATGTTPEQAKELADAWAQTFVAQVQTLYDDQHSRASIAGLAALPYRASSGQPIFNAAIGGLLGLLLGIVAAVLLGLIGRQAFVEQNTPQGRSVGEPSLTH